MGSFLPNPLALLLSSLVALALLYYKVPIKTLQQATLLIVIILVVFLNRLKIAPTTLIGRLIRATLLFLTALLLQLLVLSSGGIKSPFLILIHIYTLGTSFLVNLISSMAFLLFSIVALIGQAYFDPNIKNIIAEDLGTIFLYGASFLVIVPLSILVSRLYSLKDKLLQVVKKELKLKEIQHQALLQGISDIIFVTDKNLDIISTNEAAEKELSLPESGIIHRPLFDVLFIRNTDGKLAKAQSLSIDRVLEEKTTRILKGFQLLVRNKARPRMVDIQVRPITNLEGKVEQIMIMISDNAPNIKGSSGPHPSLEEAKIKHNALVENLKKLLILKNAPELKVRADLIWRTGADIAVLSELEDHPAVLNPVLTDVAYMCLKSISKSGDFARSLGVSLNFTLPDFSNKDITHLIPKGFQISADSLTGPLFTAPVDIKYLQHLLNKLLDLSILLSSQNKFSQVLLGVIREGSTHLKIEIFIPNFQLTEQEKDLLFTRYFGSLALSTNLALGSGLEGYIAKTIANILSIPLYVKDVNSGLIIGIKLSKGPR